VKKYPPKFGGFKNNYYLYIVINKNKNNMKKNLFVLIVIIMLSAFTSALGGMPSTWNAFFMGFGLCFAFWFCMLAPAFEIKD
jgi:hypothetical protein